MSVYDKNENDLMEEFDEEDEEEPFAIIEKLKDKVNLGSEKNQSEALQKVKKENKGLKKLLEINKEINSELDLDRLLEKIMDVAVNLTGAERGFLIMQEKGSFVIKVARNFEKEAIAKPEFKISSSIAKEVARTGEAVLAQHAQADERIGKYESVKGLNLSSVLCVPFKVKKRIIGVLYLDNRFKQGVFGEWEKYLLTTIAAQEAIALENARLFKESIRDNVTGLYAHNYFLSRVKEEIRRCELHERTLSLLILNIDGFNLINDLIGYQNGNKLLQEVGQIIAKNLRDIDILGRFSGDEYEVMLPDTSNEVAQKVANRILTAVRDRKFEKDGKKVELTMSIGVATFPRDAEEMEALLIKADEAHYAAKRQGRDQVFAFEETDEVSADKHKEYIEKEGLEPMALSRDGLVMMGMINKLIESELNLDKLLGLITSMIIEGTKAERAFFILVSNSGNLDFRWAENIDEKQIDSPEFKISRHVIETVAKKGESLLIADALEDEKFSQYESVTDLKLKSILCVPVMYKGKTKKGKKKKKNKVLGVIYLDNNQASEHFSKGDQVWIESFAEKIATPIENSWSFTQRGEELEATRQSLQHSLEDLSRKYSYNNIIGKSAAMQEVYSLLEKISGTHHPVVIHGESGTGKELIAKAIHYNGPRKGKPFVAENCAAIQDTLLEAELFGYVKGAFTGADKDKKGLFEVADGGTLFLDEVGDMSIGMQKKLLRVLQEGELRRVGGGKLIPVNVRVISASNKNLKELVKEGTFREDLFYRLNVITVNLPPLRERKEDIPLLVDHMLEQLAKENESPIKKISSGALQSLMKYDWPGNIRQLGNEVSRMVVLCGDESEIAPDDVSDKVKKGAKAATEESSFEVKPLKEILEAREKEALDRTLGLTGWNKAKAARLLDISRTTLDKKIQLYDLKPEEE